MNRKSLCLKSMFASTLLGAAGLAHAGLVGDSVGIQYLVGGTDYGQDTVTVGAGEEGNFFTNQFYDFGDTSFAIRSIGDYCGITCGGQLVQLVLSNLDFGTNVGVSNVDFTTNLSGVTVSYTADSATFSWTDQGLSVGTYISANFVTTESSNVPEPSSLALVGLAIAGLGLSRRKRGRA